MKVFKISVVVAIILLLAACGNNETPNEQPKG